MDIKDYALSDEIKKQLGYIIREMRKIKFHKYKDSNLIENNPFTKENFCENNHICHYHTLTKLETYLIKEDLVYHKLLQKLDCYYQVSRSEHQKNMEYMKSVTRKILYASEYINDVLVKDIRAKIQHINYKEDIIAQLHLNLIKTLIKLQLLIKVSNKDIEILERFITFFEGIHKGILYQCLGIYYLNILEIDKAKNYFFNAKDIYDENNISKGLISSYLIAVYVYTNDYYNSVPLCNEMEHFYKKTNNYKRLLHVNNYLSDYYFLINAHNVAKSYFNKALEIINQDNTLERYKFSLYYNWGFRCFKEYRLKEALENFITAYHFCNTKNNKLQTINMILIILTKLNFSSDELQKYYLEGEKYYKYGNESNKNIHRYFHFKLVNNRYYRRIAQEKIIPMLSEDRSKNEILLFFYEDLYK